MYSLKEFLILTKFRWRPISHNFKTKNVLVSV
jgi:COMPASS component SWD3